MHPKRNKKKRGKMSPKPFLDFKGIPRTRMISKNCKPCSSLPYDHTPPKKLSESKSLEIDVSIVGDNKARSYWAGKQPTGKQEQNGGFFVKLKKKTSVFFLFYFFHCLPSTKREVFCSINFCPSHILRYFVFFV